MPIHTHRASELVNAINSCLEENDGTIPASYAEDLVKLASNGVFSYADFSATCSEASSQEFVGKQDVVRVLEQIRPAFVDTAVRHGQASWGVLQSIDLVNPFAWVRWGLGGTKPGCGAW